MVMKTEIQDSVRTLKRHGKELLSRYTILQEISYPADFGISEEDENWLENRREELRTMSDKAKAIAKLPSTRPEAKQVKTGTCDTGEILTVNSTLNSSNIEQDPTKYENMGLMKQQGDLPSNTSETAIKRVSVAIGGMRVLGLEPKTYGLKGRKGALCKLSNDSCLGLF